MNGRLLTQIRIRHGDQTLQNLNAKYDLTVIDDDQNLSSGMMTRTIATAVTDQQIDLTGSGLTAAEFLMIESDQDISVKFNNAGNTAINIIRPRRNPGGQTVDTSVRRVGVLLVSTSGVTDLFVTNASGNLATLKILATDYIAT